MRQLVAVNVVVVLSNGISLTVMFYHFEDVKCHEDSQANFQMRISCWQEEHKRRGVRLWVDVEEGEGGRERKEEENEEE